jgi:midasin (ATPase involved in ribosome maturation)
MNILQLVISRCEKWETFAHRQISLKESTAKLTKYLFLLRNHQLSDWRELRNHREEHFSISVTSWAPQLIEFVSQLVHEMYQNVKPKQWATCENIISSLQDQSSLFSKSHVQLLWSYLEQNIFPKPLGEFEARLNIISMASYFFKVPFTE